MRSRHLLKRAMMSPYGSSVSFILLPEARENFKLDWRTPMIAVRPLELRNITVVEDEFHITM